MLKFNKPSYHNSSNALHKFTTLLARSSMFVREQCAGSCRTALRLNKRSFWKKLALSSHVCQDHLLFECHRVTFFSSCVVVFKCTFFWAANRIFLLKKFQLWRPEGLELHLQIIYFLVSIWIFQLLFSDHKTANCLTFSYHICCEKGLKVISKW